MTHKERLIRWLLLNRIENDPLARQHGVLREHVDAMSTITIMGTPEATIVTVADIYSSLRRKGVSEKDTLSLIAESRGLSVPHQCSELSSLIKYILQQEHSFDVPVSERFVDFAIGEAIRAASSRNASGENRFVALSTAAVLIGAGVAVAYFLQAWWAYALAIVPMAFGIASLKIGVAATNDELAAMTGDRPMTEEMKESIGKKMR